MKSPRTTRRRWDYLQQRRVTEKARTVYHYLDELEAQSIYIIREAYNRIDPLGMLWSIGKDHSDVVVGEKAFYGRVPFR